MLTKEDMDAMENKVVEELGVGSPEFMERHNDIMNHIDRVGEGLHEKKEIMPPVPEV